MCALKIRCDEKYLALCKKYKLTGSGAKARAGQDLGRGWQQPGGDRTRTTLDPLDL